MTTKSITSSEAASEIFLERGYLEAIPVLSQHAAQEIWEEVVVSLELNGPGRFKK